MKNCTVPAEPFRAMLAKRLEQLEAAEVEAPVLTLEGETGVGERIARRVLDENTQNVAFDTADRIVTRLEGPMAWYTDPELREIYMAVDLSAVDRRYPISVAA